MIFLIFDAQVASNRPGTHLKRCASKFCAEWWSGHLHSSHMDPIGEKTVPYTVYPIPKTLYLIPYTLSLYPIPIPKTKTAVSFAGCCRYPGSQVPG